jgi:hypothetical protein
MFRKFLVPLLVPCALLAFAATPALAKVPFAVEDLEVSANEAPTAAQVAKGELGEGPPDVQAGSHPYELVTRFGLPSEELATKNERSIASSGGGLRDVHFELPPGFVGNPTAVPKCPFSDFTGKTCPNDTAVGEATTETVRDGTFVYTVDPVYNLETPGASPAEFGYEVASLNPIYLDVSVRTGGDYGITVNVRNIPQSQEVVGSTVRIWGVPEAAAHDALRGGCLDAEVGHSAPEEYRSICPDPELEAPGSSPSEPYLTNPTSCGESRTATLQADDWEHPGNFATGENIVSESVTLPELTGCEQLDFDPSIAVKPDGEAGSTPTGLNVDLGVNQESVTNPAGLGEADVKDTTVTLPPGVQISPSAADGLEACSPAQIGFEGYRELDGSGRQTPIFTPELPKPLEPGVNFCPNSSKIATVKIKTPLLEGELKGSVYIAAPQNFMGLPENPFSSLIAMYIVAEEPFTGILLKLAGHGELGEPGGSNGLQPGQIRTTFENTPELPYSEVELEFYGTNRAPLATPALCGTYNTQTTFEPWSHQPASGEVEGTPDSSPPSSFNISSGPVLETATGPQTSACADPLPFKPTLASGTTNNNAGAFSNLTTTLSREDGQQSIQQVTLHYPPGVTGLLSGVKLCGEAQANAGTCGPESLIGETIVSVGLGNDPFTVTGGKVYITGPYEGAPFGLSIVNPAKAGPFNLQEGRPVVVRATINVDPHTAALTITTDPSGEHAIPNIIDGIPLQIKHVYVAITRSGFTFNPTNCNPTEISGTIGSAEGASSPVKIPFQVANCEHLKFEPKISVFTQGHTSKADGASLTYKVTYPNVPFGTDANIKYVKVELPGELPSRLTTLQKACTQAQFQANPAGCPAASNIGHAKAIVPNIPVPLEGPVYFVSNGGEAFPNLVMVLQGYGVTIQLVGDTLIRNGVTSTTFNAIPDNPVTSFEITLPEGPYSALAANGNLCKPTVAKVEKVKQRLFVKGKLKTVTRRLKEQVATSLTIPSDYVGQNGATYDAKVPISVTGCPKAKVAKKVKKHKAKHKAKKK